MNFLALLSLLQVVLHFTEGNPKKTPKRSTCLSTDSSRISAVELENIVERLRHQQYRDSTKRNYYAIWKLFANFLVQLDYCPWSWEDRIVLFVGYLIDNNKQSSTVKSYVSAIRAVLRDDKIKLDEDQYLITSLTRACRLKNDAISARMPIQRGMLSIVLKQIEKAFKAQPYLAQLYRCIFSTMYFGLLRVSEVASGPEMHPVKAVDVHIGENKKKFLLILRTSKTHWKNNAPQLVKITATKCHSHVKNKPMKDAKLDDSGILPCPYQLLKGFAESRGNYQSNLRAFLCIR